MEDRLQDGWVVTPLVEYPLQERDVAGSSPAALTNLAINEEASVSPPGLFLSVCPEVALANRQTHWRGRRGYVEFALDEVQHP